jgi:hypothetical protein
MTPAFRLVLAASLVIIAKKPSSIRRPESPARSRASLSKSSKLLHSALLFALLFVIINRKDGSNIDEIFTPRQMRIFSTKMLARLAAATLAGFANWVASNLSH